MNRRQLLSAAPVCILPAISIPQQQSGVVALRKLVDSSPPFFSDTDYAVIKRSEIEAIMGELA